MKVASRPRKWSTIGRRVLSLFLATLVAVTGLTALEAVTTTQKAEAAAYGPGWDMGLGFLGAYRVGSTNVFCLDIEAAPPTGNTTGPSYGGWRGLNETQMARLSWAIQRGQGNDPTRAAATNLYVWSIADSTAYNSHGMSGDSYYIARIPQANRQAVLNELAVIRNGAESIRAGQTGGGGQLTFQVDPVNNYRGTLTLQNLTPASASGSITLTNGRFTSNNSSTISVSGNGSWNITGIPPNDTTVDYRISAEGNFNAGGGLRGEIAIYSTPGQQPLGGPGRPATGTFSISAEDPTARSTEFRPVASTVVASTRLNKGDRFVDDVTVALASGGNQNPWRQTASGAYLPIEVRGTVYGPYASRPAQRATVPANAPVAGTFTVNANRGPGTYRATSNRDLNSSGFYVAVVEIDAAHQSASNPPVRRFLPDGYRFQDAFGQRAETSIVPFEVDLVTQLQASEVIMGDSIRDDVRAVLRTGERWLTDGGSNVSIDTVGTWYYSPTKPRQAPTRPLWDPQVEVIGTTQLSLNGPNVTRTSAPVTMPYKYGWVTVQWCTVRSDYVARTCDDWGVPAETAEIVGPEFETLAQEYVSPGGYATDTLIVTGPMPRIGVEFFSTVFIQDEDFVEGVSTPVCDDSTQFWFTQPHRNIRENGSYDVEMYFERWAPPGRVAYWSETVRPSGRSEVLHIGECGLENERTYVEWPEVRTEAVRGAQIGDEIHDVAIVTGPMPYDPMELTFYAYLQPEDATEPMCTPETLIYQSVPKLITEAGEHRSEGTMSWDEEGWPVTSEEGLTVTEDMLGRILWQEHLTLETFVYPTAFSAEESEKDSDLAVELMADWTYDPIDGYDYNHLGECGAPSEITDVYDVATQAVNEAFTLEPVFDTAIVRGTVPVNEGERAELTFEVFRDVNGAESCIPENRVYSSEDEPVLVTTAGEYQSPQVAFSEAGTYYWVETLSLIRPEPEEPAEGEPGEEEEIVAQPNALPEEDESEEGLPENGDTEEVVEDEFQPVSVLHVGECAIAAETTVIVDPPVPPTSETPPGETPPGTIPPGPPVTVIPPAQPGLPITGVMVTGVAIQALLGLMVGLGLLLAPRIRRRMANRALEQSAS